MSAAIEQQIRNLEQEIRDREQQIAGLRMALSAVESVSVSASAAKTSVVAASVRKPHHAKSAATRQAPAGESSTTWQDALREQCAIWSMAVKSGLKAEQDGTNGQLKYPAGRIPLAAVTNKTSWPNGTLPTIPVAELKENGFNVLEEGGNKFLVFPTA